MNNSIVIFNPAEIDGMQRVAKAMVASGYFKDTRDIAQAFVKILAGRELGIPPFAAMTGINIIQGKPALGANVIATLVKNDPRYDYRVVKCNDAICTLEWFEDGKAAGESSFTIDEAKRAGLTGKDNWQKYPSDMLFARTISRGARRFAPGIFGGAPVYTPDELGADIDPEGYVDFDTHQDIEGEYTEDPPTPKNPAPTPRQQQTPAQMPPQNNGATEATTGATVEDFEGLPAVFMVGDEVASKKNKAKFTVSAILGGSDIEVANDAGEVYIVNPDKLRLLKRKATQPPAEQPPLIGAFDNGAFAVEE